MFTRFHALLRLLIGAGPTRPTVRAVNDLTRFEVLDVLREAGFFGYLRTPITLPDLLNALDMEENTYTRYALDVLSNPDDGVLDVNGDVYQLREDAVLPTWEQMKRQLPELVLTLHPMFQTQAQRIISRMRGTETPFVENLKITQQSMMAFDDTLGSRIYDTIRIVSHIWAEKYLHDLPDGASLLTPGCGSGRETAHVYTLTKGKYRITACDPVSSFIDMAKERFPYLLREFNNGLDVRVPEDRAPQFHVMPVGKMDFPDQSFDAVFHATMLHWTPDPEQSINEMFRVLKPGGVIYGMFSYRPQINIFMDLLIRSNEQVGGYPWLEDILRWHRSHGAEVEMLTTGIYRARRSG